MKHEKIFLTSRHATVWTYLGCMLLCSAQVAYGADESEHDDTMRAAPAVTMSVLKEYIANVTGKGFNGASMNNVALYNDIQQSDSLETLVNSPTMGNLALAELVNSPSVGNTTLGSLVNSATCGNSTLGIISTTYASLVPLAGVTSGELIAWDSPVPIIPAGIITINSESDSTAITFTEVGMYVVTGIGTLTGGTGGSDLTIAFGGDASKDPDNGIVGISAAENLPAAFSFTQVITVAPANQTLTYTLTATNTGTITNLRLFITRLS